MPRMPIMAHAQPGFREGCRALPGRGGSTGLRARVRVALIAILIALTFPGRLTAQPPFVIRIEMGEFAFRPAVIRLPLGRPARIVFTNNGQIAHQVEAAYLQRTSATVVTPTIRVEAAGLDIVRVDPAGSARIEFVPRAAGRFPFACTIEGHQEAGMTGTLEIR